MRELDKRNNLDQKQRKTGNEMIGGDVRTHEAKGSSGQLPRSQLPRCQMPSYTNDLRRQPFQDTELINL